MEGGSKDPKLVDVIIKNVIEKRIPSNTKGTLLYYGPFFMLKIISAVNNSSFFNVKNLNLLKKVMEETNYKLHGIENVTSIEKISKKSILSRFEIKNNPIKFKTSYYAMKGEMYAIFSESYTAFEIISQYNSFDEKTDFGFQMQFNSQDEYEFFDNDKFFHYMFLIVFETLLILESLKNLNVIWNSTEFDLKIVRVKPEHRERLYPNYDVTITSDYMPLFTNFSKCVVTKDKTQNDNDIYVVNNRLNAWATACTTNIQEKEKGFYEKNTFTDAMYELNQQVEIFREKNDVTLMEILNDLILEYGTYLDDDISIQDVKVKKVFPQRKSLNVVPMELGYRCSACGSKTPKFTTAQKSEYFCNQKCYQKWKK